MQRADRCSNGGMSRPFGDALACLLGLSLAATATGQEPDSQVRADWGVRVSRPGKEWRFAPAADGGASDRLDLVRRPRAEAIGARFMGVRVEAEVLEQGLDCIERGRNDNGAFDYMVGTQPGNGTTGQSGAAGRGPLCELAPLRGGRSDLDRLREALAIFRDHRQSYDKERGKVLMHAGPDGQGCHDLFFDYATAATAVGELTEEERAAHRDWLLELILPARSVEGGFRDTPRNGWAFGKGMARTAFRELRVD